MAKEVKKAGSSAGEIVLQWLTYAFWGWFILALTWLVASTTMHFLGQKGNETFGPSASYGVAAVVVLFVVSYVADRIYSKHEPSEKHGVAQVVMIIHAVLFALSSIGAAIFSVFALVSMVVGDVNSYDTVENKQTMLITGLVVALLFALLALRTLRPLTLWGKARGYRLVMSVVTGAVLVAASVGPLAYLYNTKQDRLIETGLPMLSNDISNYVSSKNHLPGSLADITPTSKEVETLLAEHLVTYTPNTKPTTATAPDVKTLELQPDTKTYSYQLCVVYADTKNQFNNKYATTYMYPAGSTSPDVYTHAKGKVCYDLVAYNYGAVEPAVDAVR